MQHNNTTATEEEWASITELAQRFNLRHYKITALIKDHNLPTRKSVQDGRLTLVNVQQFTALVERLEQGA